MAMSQEQIESLIDYANNQVRELVDNFNFETFENDKDKQRLIIALSRLYDEMNVTMANVLPPAIYETYLSSLKHAESLMVNAGMAGVGIGSKGVESIVQAPIHVEAINNVVSDTLDDLAAAFRTAKKYSIQEVDKAVAEVKQEITNGMIAGFTNKQIMKRVGEKFGQYGMTSFVTRDGKHLPLDFYAKTVTRTKMQTAYNHGHLNRYEERKVKHVEIAGNIPTCAECSVYRGLVFATERGDEFPYIDLYKTFPVHPNCQCNFRPWIKKFKRDEEINRVLELSENFDPDKDTRTKSEAKKYDVNQKAKADARKKRLTFNKLKTQLGQDGPQTFKEFKNASKRQYHDWVAQSKKLYNENGVQKSSNGVILNSEISNHIKQKESNVQIMTDNEKEKLINYAKEEWEPKLSESEIVSLLDYTGSEYADINDYLMGAIKPTDKEFVNELEQSIKGIRNALDKFHYKGNVVAYRGVSAKEFEFIKQNTKTFSFVDFKSTSISELTAKGIAKKDIHGKPYIIKFIIPSNAKGAYIESVSSVPGEFEYLLSDNQNYIVREIEHKEYNLIEVEVLGNE